MALDQHQPAHAELNAAVTAIGNAMRHVAGGDMPPRGVDVVKGVVEEDVRTERLQKLALVSAAKKHPFVQSHTPFAQGAYDALVGRRGPGGDQGGADRRCFAYREGFLKLMQGLQEAAERTA